MFIAVCVAYPISAWFVKCIIGGFFVGSYSGMLNNSFIMCALNPLEAYDGTNVIYWIIFTIVCLAASAFLVRNRKAERAQSSFAYYLPCHLVKILVSFLAGMFLGVIFGSVNALGNGFAGFVFGFIIASAAAFIISHLIFYKGFSKLIRTSVTLGGLIIVVIAGVAICNFDIFGYNSFVPNADDVSSAGFIDSEYCYYEPNQNIGSLIINANTDYEDAEYINTIIDAQKTAIEEVDFSSYQKFQYVWIDMFEGRINYTGSDWIGFSYKMKNGSTVTRVYSDSIFYDMFGIEDDYDSISEVNTAIEKITKTKTYQLKYSSMMNSDTKFLYSMDIDGDTGSKDAYADIYYYYDTSETRKKLAEDIFNAYRKDFEADTTSTDTALFLVGNSDFYSSFIYDIQSKKSDAVCVIKINIDTSISDDDAGLLESILNNLNIIDRYEYFVVPKSYTNTINVLKNAKILTDDLNMNIGSAYVYDYEDYIYDYDYNYYDY